MEQVTLQRRVCLDPRYLDTRYKETLLETVRRHAARECSREHGYIVDVLRLVRILDNKIANANSDVVFLITVEATVLNPRIGSVLSGTVHKVVAEGLFVLICGRTAVFVPRLHMSDACVYRGTGTPCIVDERVGTVYRLHDAVQVHITNARYMNGRYQYLARLA